MTRPPFPYFGGKATSSEQIAALFPDHKHYVEPFAGSLAVLLAKRPSPHETVNDIDNDIMTFWRVLRDRPEELAHVCRLTPHSRGELELAHFPAGDELEQARRTWVLLTQGRSMTTRTSSRQAWRQTKSPGASGHSMPDRITSFASRIESAAERLRGVSLELRDALEVIADYGRHRDVLIYADPPYLTDVLAPSSRMTARYRHQMGSEAQHRALADALHSCAAAVVLSGYDSPLYDDLFSGWHVHRMAATAGHAREKRERVEVLWSNRPLAATLPLGEPLRFPTAEAGGFQPQAAPETSKGGSE